MNPNEALNFAIVAGEIMLSSGAETYRVEDTIIRILNSCGFMEAEAFAASTGIFATISDSGGSPVTILRRVKRRVINFEKITLVNDISRGLAEGKLTLDEAMKQLESVNSAHSYSRWVQCLASLAACFCFTYLAGGELPDCVNAALTGFLVQGIIIWLRRRKVVSLLTNFAGGMAIALFALTLNRLGLGSNINTAIIGSIMPLVPGVSFTNAVRDVFEGDYLSGGAGIMDAFITGVGIAAGVGSVLQLWYLLLGGAL